MASCSACGSVIGTQARFCGECGRPVTLPAAKASPVAREPLPNAKVNGGFARSWPREANYRVSDLTKAAVPKTVFVIPDSLAQEFGALLGHLNLSPQDVCIVERPDDIERVIRALHAKHAPRPPEYLCLIGSWEQIPAKKIPSPLQGDDDEFCRCDLAWGLAEPDRMADDPAIDGIPVGRIPVLDLEAIRGLLCYEEPISRSEHAVNLAISAECWADATHEIVRSQGGHGILSKRITTPVQRSFLSGQSVLLSPNWREPDLIPVLGCTPNRETTLLFNVHGSPDDPAWVGEGSDGDCIRIFSPEQVESFARTILVTEACYGGAMGYDSPSIVETFFMKGGFAFLGASVIAYGSDNEDLAGADLMAQFFIQAVQSGESFGRAHAIARRQLAESDPWANDVSMKTLVSFNFFGLPWMKKAGAGRDLSARPDQASGILSRLREARASGARDGSPGVLDRARASYRARLPDAEQTFLEDAAQILNKLQGFRDFETISRTLKKFDSSALRMRLESMSRGGETGYRLRLKALDGQRGARYKIIVTDAEGRIRKSISSKGYQ